MADKDEGLLQREQEIFEPFARCFKEMLQDWGIEITSDKEFRIGVNIQRAINEAKPPIEKQERERIIAEVEKIDKRHTASFVLKALKSS